MDNRVLLFVGLSLLLVNVHCARKQRTLSSLSLKDSTNIVQESLFYRAESDSFFRYAPDSPFNRDTTIRYKGIRWFPVDVRYAFQSKLSLYERPETVIIFGTKGDPRQFSRYGYFTVMFENHELHLNVYKPLPSENRVDQLEVWFTDETTGNETYQVGRYIHVGEEHADRNHLYSINFNNAYNPYCAYSPLYSCAIPRKENHLPVAIRAGELIYHSE